MVLPEEYALARGFILDLAQGGYKPIPMSTMAELQLQLALRNSKWTPRILVLPGYLDDAAIDVLTSQGGIPKDFLIAHKKHEAYRSRGRRSQDDVTTYCWKFPQRVHLDYAATETSHYIDPREEVILLNASLYFEHGVPLLLIDRPMTKTPNAQPLEEPTLEEELREKLPKAGVGMHLEDYVNQLIYERWVELIAGLQVGDPDDAFIYLRTMRAIEQNLDQARYLSACGKNVYVADEVAWKDIILRLERRLSLATACGQNLL